MTPANPFRIVHGTLRDAQASAFVDRQGREFYIRSFLDHHRRIGVDQFIILDDQSTDGTRELLAAQPDCVVLESPFTYGRGDDAARAVRRATHAGRHRRQVADPAALPRRPLRAVPRRRRVPGAAAGVASLGELVELLAKHDVASVAATLVDFFPATVAEMQQPREFPTAEAMLGAYPYFDAVPLLAARGRDRVPAQVDYGATARLFRKHHVRTVPDVMLRAPRWLNRAAAFRCPRTSVFKTPIVRWDPGVEYLNSHRANVPPSGKVLVGLAHMKFNCDLARRVDYALDSKVYVRGSRKYQWYDELLAVDAARRAGRFLGPHSRRYRGQPTSRPPGSPGSNSTDARATAAISARPARAPAPAARRPPRPRHCGSRSRRCAAASPRAGPGRQQLRGTAAIACGVRCAVAAICSRTARRIRRSWSPASGMATSGRPCASEWTSVVPPLLTTIERIGEQVLHFVRLDARQEREARDRRSPRRPCAR